MAKVQLGDFVEITGKYAYGHEFPQFRVHQYTMKGKRGTVVGFVPGTDGKVPIVRLDPNPNLRDVAPGFAYDDFWTKKVKKVAGKSSVQIPSPPAGKDRESWQGDAYNDFLVDDDGNLSDDDTEFPDADEPPEDEEKDDFEEDE